MSKFTKVVSVAGMVMAGVGLILGTVTQDDAVFQSALSLGIMMMVLTTTHTVLEIREIAKKIEKGMDNNE